MERRAEPRLETDYPVTVTRLDGNHNSAVHARIVNVSGRGLGLELHCPIPAGALVQIECRDHLLLGEVVYGQPGRDGLYTLGLNIEHSLRLSEVLPLLEAVSCP